MRELIEEEMSRNLSWASDLKIRTAVKLVELFVLATSCLLEILAFAFDSPRELLLLQVISCSMFVLILYSRIFVTRNYLFALKVWTSYVMKVHLCIYAKTLFYSVVIFMPLILDNHDYFISTLWLAISGIDFDIRSMAINNLRITPRS
jgi:hypothetical protein